jgi:hypothetical protein
MVFSVVLLWLGGFFYCAFVVFSDVLWWLSSFSVVLWWGFLLLMVLALPLLVFLLFEVIRD